MAPCSDSVSLRLQTSKSLTSLRTITRRLILQKAYRHTPLRPKTQLVLRSLVGTRVQVSFTPRQGCFSPFPLGTLLYRSSDIFSLRPWAAQIQPEFHVLRPTQVPFTGRRNAFAYGALTLYGWLSQYHSTDLAFGNCPRSLQQPPERSYYPVLRNACRLARNRFRLLPFRSPLLRVSLRFLLCPATEMFHFADFAPAYAGLRPKPEGLPHSDIPGSRVACTSPGHFVACHVLLRCRMPWHPPCALSSFLSNTALPSIRLSSYTGKIQTSHKGIRASVPDICPARQFAFATFSALRR